MLNAQNNWKVNGNNINTSDFLGTTNNKNLVIKTNDTTRMVVKKNGGVDVNGQLQVDSLHIIGGLKIGANTLSITNNPDLIRSTNGQISFGGSGANFFNNIRLGVGIQNPVHKIHIGDLNPSAFGQPQPVNLAFGNNSLFNGGTGFGITDGFQIGILGNQDAELRQFENKNMLFFTNNTERIRILNNGFVGINTSTPTNTFELNSGTANTSGFKFTQLNSGSPTQVNPGKVLSVDANGNVILVPQTGGGNITGCGGNNNFITKFISATTICNSQIYDDANQVLIGSTTPIYSESKIEVVNNNTGGRYGITASLNGVTPSLSQYVFNGIINTGQHGTQNIAFFGQVAANVGAFQNVGSQVLVTGTSGLNTSNVGYTSIVYGLNSFRNIGISSSAIDAFLTTGGSFKSTSNSTNGSSARGIDVDATNGEYNFGIINTVGNISLSSIANYGIYSTIYANGYAQNGNYAAMLIAPPTNGNIISYALYSQSPSQTTIGAYLAGYFNGNVQRIGLDNFASDINLKENIVPITNASDLLLQLNPVSFNFKNSSYPQMSFPLGLQYGLIAQEVEPILPLLVSNSIHPEQFDTAGNQISTRIEYKSLNYEGFIPLLIKGFKEQVIKMDSLVALVDSLKELMTGNRRLFEDNTASNEEIKLYINDMPRLGYPSPNPNSGYIEVPYYIPENYTDAKLVFRDALVSIIGEKSLTQKGYNKLQVDLIDLLSGVYTCTLVVNNKICDSKKIIKSN